MERELLQGRVLDQCAARAMGWHLDRYAGMFELKPPVPVKSRALFREEADAWGAVPAYSTDPKQLVAMLEWAAAQGMRPVLGLFEGSDQWEASVQVNAVDYERRGASPGEALARALVRAAAGEG